MARLGMRVAAFTYVGDDEWADVIRRRYAAEGVDTSALITHPTVRRAPRPCSSIRAASGRFVHCVGAPRLLDKRGDAVATRSVRQEPSDADRLLPADDAAAGRSARSAGRDSRNGLPHGASMRPATAARWTRWRRFCRTSISTCRTRLRPQHQTGRSEPRAMIAGVSRGRCEGLARHQAGCEGCALEPAAGRVHRCVGREGAGHGRRHDRCRRLLLRRRSWPGVLRGLPPADAGRLAAATGACCVTGLGGYDRHPRL